MIISWLWIYAHCSRQLFETYFGCRIWVLLPLLLLLCRRGIPKKWQQQAQLLEASLSPFSTHFYPHCCIAEQLLFFFCSGLIKLKALKSVLQTLSVLSNGKKHFCVLRLRCQHWLTWTQWMMEQDTIEWKENGWEQRAMLPSQLFSRQIWRFSSANLG